MVVVWMDTVHIEFFLRLRMRREKNGYMDSNGHIWVKGIRMQEYPVTGGIGLPSNIPNLIAVRGDSESLKSITAPELNLKI